jgi:transposase
MGISRKEAAQRRREIVRLHNAGLGQAAIAAITNCRQATVSKVLINFKKMGEATFCIKSRKGGKKRFRITEAQKEELRGFLKQGADKFGFADERWINIRVAELIYEKFGVKYNSYYMGRFLKKLGISV